MQITMTDTLAALDQQIAACEETLRLIAQRKAEYVLTTDVPLQLVREEEQAQAKLAELQDRRARLRDTPCPYRGLEVFEVAHAANYFGRQAMTQKLVDKVAAVNFIAVVGPSGSGKSSLVRAGLLTALNHGALPNSRDWVSRTFRPGSDPLFALTVALIDLLDPALSERQRVGEARAWAEDLKRGKVRIDDALRRLKERLPHLPCLLLIADQFEETFTLCEDDALRQRFLDVLLVAATLPWCKVLITLRADFYGRVLERQELSQRVDSGLVNIIPMTAEERRAAIEQPALAAGRRLEDGLVNRMVAAVEQEPGQLPLLEFALTELWARQSAEGVLTHAAYEAIGEVAGAIARRADETLRSFDADEQAQVRTVFTRLVRVAQPAEGAEDTRQRIELDELDATVRPLVQKLADARLLVTSRDERTGEETVEVAHEALIRGWRELQMWLNADREFLLWRQRLRGLIETWEGSGRDESALLRGALLGESDRWLRSRAADLNESEKGFITASQAAAAAARQREEARAAELAAERARADEQVKTSRRFRRFALALAALVVVTLVATYFAWDQGRRADGERLQALAARGTAEAASKIAVAQAGVARVAEDEARQQAEIAQTAQVRAENERAEAVRARATAVAAQAASEELRRFIRADQLAQTALVIDREEHLPQRGLLLSIEAVRAFSPPVPSALQAIYTLPNRVGGMKLGRYEDAVWTVAFSPDGKWLASGSRDATIRLWQVDDPATEPLVLRGHEDAVWSVAFSPDGQWLASGSTDSTIRLWQVDNPAVQPLVLRGHEDDVRSVAFSPDGRLLASGSWDNTIRLWQVDNPAVQPLVLRGHENGIYAVAFSPDGKQLASGGYDKTIRLWQVDDPADQSFVLRGHQTYVWSVAFSPDGKWLASASADNTVRLWQVAEPTAQPLVLRGHEASVRTVAFSPDGWLLASGSWDNTIRLWQVAEPDAEPLVLRGHDGDVWSVAFSPDGRLLASGSRDYTVRLWELDEANIRPLVLRGHDEAVLSVAFSPDGKRLASGGADYTIRLWQVNNPDVQPLVLRGHENFVWSVTFSPDGKQLASGSTDYTIRLWQVDEPTAQPLVLRSAYVWPVALVYSVVFSPDGTLLASGNYDKTIRLWQVAEPTAQPQMLRGHGDGIFSMAFSPDGRWLASGSLDDTIRLWQVDEPTAEPRVLRGHEGDVWSVAFSPDGRWLASGSLDDTIRLWQVDEPDAEPLILRGHENDVRSVAFSPDGKWLASGSLDYTIRLWQVDEPTAQPLVLRGHEGNVWSVAFSPDGRQLASASEDFTVRLWHVKLEDIIDLACRTAGRNLTQDEWAQYFRDEQYRVTCPQWPAGE
jgi:WD40 repeat protein/energy-coupling factor transporter ATP-binding protein EcfA2